LADEPSGAITVTMDLADELARRYRLPRTAQTWTRGRGFRSLGLTDRILACARRPLTRDWRASARAMSADRYAPSALPTPSLSLIYRLTNQAARTTFYAEYLRLALSLSINTLVQNLQLDLLLGPQISQQAAYVERTLARVLPPPELKTNVSVPHA
jgi:hypothetical protein